MGDKQAGNAMRRHLLVTNDYPPKVGGIQSYLWELWRRLPAEDVAVHTTPYNGTESFDAQQDYTLTRSKEPVLLPHRWVRRRAAKLAAQHQAEMIIWDPALPVGLAAPRVKFPYAVVLHGAEVTIPGRLPITRQLLARVLRRASLVICAGQYAAAEAQRAAKQELPTVIIPPGVDTERFKPLSQEQRRTIRRKLGLDETAPLVVSVSRLVPRKGMDTLIKASLEIQKTIPNVTVAIAGTGRDEKRLKKLIETTDAPVKMLGRVDDDLLPGLYGAGDVFAMLCRTRWAGLEQEGFGIVFVEAAAAGVPQVAGQSGGAAEAVSHGETGLVVDPPDDPKKAAAALIEILNDPAKQTAMGQASRQRALKEFSYQVLADRLQASIDQTTLRETK
jgi:phosphatidylinositol alpha-1,6-mannosyltransferase